MSEAKLCWRRLHSAAMLEPTATAASTQAEPNEAAAAVRMQAEPGEPACREAKLCRHRLPAAATPTSAGQR